jgi:hypothetical protein
MFLLLWRRRTNTKSPFPVYFLQLFSDIVPKTAENFRALCTGVYHLFHSIISFLDKDNNRCDTSFRIRTFFITGEKGIGKSGKPLHYKGCTFHRVHFFFICSSFVHSLRDLCVRVDHSQLHDSRRRLYSWRWERYRDSHIIF